MQMSSDDEVLRIARGLDRGRLAFNIDDLIRYLDQIYPEKSPERGELYADIMFAAGQRSVVRHLLRLQDEGRI